MKQTVVIRVINRLETKGFITDFDPMRSDAGQLIAFMECHNIEKQKYELHKCFEYNPKTQFWIPRFDLVEISELSMYEIKNNGVNNAKS